MEKIIKFPSSQPLKNIPNEKNVKYAVARNDGKYIQYMAYIQEDGGYIRYFPDLENADLFNSKTEAADAAAQHLFGAQLHEFFRLSLVKVEITVSETQTDFENLFHAANERINASRV